MLAVSHMPMTILLSASLCNLQSMLDVCHNVGSSLDIAFNSSKSFLFNVGLGFVEYLSRLNIGCDDIQWTDRLKYYCIYNPRNLLQFVLVQSVICSNCKSNRK